jgi:MFS family permease
VVTIEVPKAPAPAVAVEPVEEEVIEPVPLARRLRTATRVGAWTGAALGLFAFLAASTLWAPNASVTGEETFSPVIQVESSDVIIGTALVSILLGAIVAGLSRAAAGWVAKGMRLSNSPFSTGFIGAALGLVLGLVAGSLLTSAFGEPLEGAEGVVQLPVLATLVVMMLGGAVLGAVTAVAPQLVGVPVAVGAEGGDEVDQVKSRLAGAIGVPTAAALLLAILVLPFAYTLIKSNHLTSGGAAIIAVITAAGILAFAALGGNKPNMRLSFGEVMIAVLGIATVILVIFMVLNTRDTGEQEEENGGAEAAVVQLLS